MKTFGLAVMLLQLLPPMVIAQPAVGSHQVLDTVKNKVVSAMAAGWNTYSICEHVDRSGKPAYVAKIIPASELPASADAIVARHFVLQRQPGSAGADFSLYSIRYATRDAAMHAVNAIRTGTTGTVADGKVLTRYALQSNGEVVYIIGTQSFLHPAMKAFLDSFGAGKITVR